MARQLPQNLKALLQEIGENAALLHLSLKLGDHPDWRVYKNYADAGRDLVLLHKNGRKESVSIEVKTRQNQLTDRKAKNGVHFTLSQSEKDNSDFVIAYWFDRNAFFVVPSESLVAVNSKGRKLYKFIAYVSSRTDQYNESTIKYLDAWGLLLDRLK